MPDSIELTLNGKPASVARAPARPLLEALREDLGLTGTKYGCGEGQCGACTVLIDGKPARSCITPVAQAEGKKIQTIEGLAGPAGLHPVQRAFLEAGAMQCGYCVPGMIMTAAGLIAENANPSRAEIVDWMNGNICRCCSYPAMIEAVEKAAALAREAKP